MENSSRRWRIFLHMCDLGKHPQGSGFMHAVGVAHVLSLRVREVSTLKGESFKWEMCA